MTSSYRPVIDALLPPGPLWVPKPGGDFDNLLTGQATNYEDVKQFLGELADIRDPLKTAYLSDAEKEWGLVPNPDLTEAERRDRLLAAKTSGGNEGTDEYIQAKLQLAGFGLYVHRNNPAVDPSLFIFTGSGAIFGDSDTVFGAAGAVMGGTNGEYVVNGDLFYNELDWLGMFGRDISVMGGADTQMGATSGALIRRKVTYPDPTDPIYWPLVFFIGGEATRDPSTGALTQIDTAQVPASRRDELISLIVKYKPAHTWCGLLIELTS